MNEAAKIIKLESKPTGPGKRIRQRRQQLSMMQRDLSKRSGVSQATISRFESGAIRGLRSPNLQSLADVLNVSTSWILEGNETPLGASADRKEEKLLEFFQGLSLADQDCLIRVAAGLAGRRHE